MPLPPAPPFDLDAFCAAHPAHEADLRAHLDALSHVDAALSGGTTLRERGRVRDALRRLLAEDRSRGDLRPLGHYRPLFPGFEEMVAEEYALLAPAVGSTGDDPDARETVRRADGAEGDGVPLGLTGPGDRLGPYRLRKEIGRGGMGVVYLAEETRLGRRAAVKVLSPVFTTSPEIRRRFQREAAVASRLDHPGICTVYEVGEASGIPFIAMRFVEGETLEQHIHAARTGGGSAGSPGTHLTNLPRPVDEPAAAPPSPTADLPPEARGAGTRQEIHRLLLLVERAARALHHAHEAGLVHRDIKPGNIMVTLEGEPVLLDFGLARDDSSGEARLTQTGALMGTPAYMSPEQITAHRIRLDRRTDVYSLGVTLYEALTLRLPFEAPSRDSLYQKILVTHPRNPRLLNPALPEDLGVVLDKVMEKDRDRRYATAEDFAEELRRVRMFEPIRARPPTPVTRIRRWTQRNRGAATALGIVLLLVALVPPLVGLLLRKARNAARDSLLERSLLTPHAEVIRAAEGPAAPMEVRFAASKLKEGDRLHALGQTAEARLAVQEALGLLQGNTEGAALAEATRRILETLDAEPAKGE